MPRLGPGKLPSYRLHKQSGQAIVTLGGRDVLLGQHKSPASREAYDRAIAEWLAAGRTAPAPAQQTLSVSELILRFIRHAQTFYARPDGTVSREVQNYAEAMGPLRRLYGATPAAEFGPLKLKAVRLEMVRMQWVRTYVNRQASRVRAVFKWASENELIPPSVYHGLIAVSGLRRGQCEVSESTPVRPVPAETVAATLPHLPPRVQSMVRLQELTGMRSGELCAMKGLHLVTTEEVWTYRPEQHKTLHHGHGRIIYIGPAAQQILKPLLKPDLTAFIFSPADSEAIRHGQQREERQTPVQPSQRSRAERSKRRKRQRPPLDHYDPKSYRRAIDRACRKAFPPPKELEQPGKEKAMAQWHADHSWHPHQLRHSFATNVRREFGPDAALVLLGDQTTRMVDVYAEKDREKAEDVVRRIG